MSSYIFPTSILITFFLFLISIITTFYGCLNDDYCIRYSITNANITNLSIVNSTCTKKIKTSRHSNTIKYDCYNSIISLDYNSGVCNVVIEKDLSKEYIINSLNDYTIGNNIKIYRDQYQCKIENDSICSAIVSLIFYPFTIFSIIYTIKKHYNNFLCNKKL